MHADDGPEFFRVGVQLLREGEGVFGQCHGARRLGVKLVHDDRAKPARPLDAT